VTGSFDLFGGFMGFNQIRVDGDFAFVKLTQGYDAIINVADIGLVAGNKWSALVEKRKDGSVRNVYAKGHGRDASGRWKTVYMHRVVANTPHGMHTDHIDGNGLNNTRSNLRAVTAAQNQHNQRRHSDSSSVVKGASLHKPTGKWRSQIAFNGKRTYLGCFNTMQEALNAYAKASSLIHGEFGRAT
jgi:hypothetical protein